MAKWKRGIKVAYRTIDESGKFRYWSWFSAPGVCCLYVTPRASVQYLPGKDTKRCKGRGPLTVFSSKRAALIFLGGADSDPNIATLPCLYKESKQKRLWFRNAYGRQYGKTRPPKGTRFANAVRAFEPLEEKGT